MSDRLTDLQRELLDLFSMDVSDEELQDVKRLLAHYFASQASASFDAWAEMHGVDADTLAEWAEDHERASTDRA